MILLLLKLLILLINNCFLPQRDKRRKEKVHSEEGMQTTELWSCQLKVKYMRKMNDEVALGPDGEGACPPSHS